MSEIALSQAPAHLRHGSNIGQPLTRREGVLKVTGRARFAADKHPPGMLYAVLAVSSIARGRDPRTFAGASGLSVCDACWSSRPCLRSC